MNGQFRDNNNIWPQRTQAEDKNNKQTNKQIITRKLKI